MRTDCICALQKSIEDVSILDSSVSCSEDFCVRCFDVCCDSILLGAVIAVPLFLTKVTYKFVLFYIDSIYIFSVKITPK